MKLKSMLLTATIMALALLMSGASFAASELAANPTPSEVNVNNESVAFEAYIIEGNNYFKLRDIAKILSGTEKQFNVTWDAKNSRINLLTTKPYESVGGELSKGDNLSKVAIKNKSEIYKDGKLLQNLSSYTINGNNFFKLRDIASEFNVGIGYDNVTRLITVDTTIDYVAPVSSVVVDKKLLVVRIEAENRSNIIETFRGEIIDIEDADGGFALGFFQMRGDSITVKNSPSAKYVTFRYATDMFDMDDVILVVDGKEFSRVTFPKTNDYNIYKEVTFKVAVPKGADFKIELGDYGAINIDYIEFSDLDTHEGYVPAVVKKPEVIVKPKAIDNDALIARIEAEDPLNIIVGNALMGNITDDGGGSALTYFQNAGDSITIKNSPSAKSLTFRYANTRDVEDVILFADGKELARVKFPETTGYNVYKEIIFEVAVPKGVDFKVELGNDGAINIDYIEFNYTDTLERTVSVPVAVNTPVKTTPIDPKTVDEDMLVARVEAEDPSNIVVGRARKGNITDGGGGSALTYFQNAGDSITIKNSPSAKSLTFRYANISDIENVILFADGKELARVKFPKTMGYNVYKEITFEVAVPKGVELKIALGDYGALNIDYIEFNYTDTLERTVSGVVNEPVTTTPTAPKTEKVTVRLPSGGTNITVEGGGYHEKLWYDGIAPGPLETVLVNFNQYNAFIRFREVPEATSLVFRYSATRSHGGWWLYVNGIRSREVIFNATADEYTYRNRTVKINIKEGDIVMLKYEAHCKIGINLMYVDFVKE